MANTKITTNVIADGAITSAKLDTNITISGNITGTLATAAQPNITSLGTLTALTVDDITINGSTISDAGDLTLDVAGDIILDADGGNVKIVDNGVVNLDIYKYNSNVYVDNPVADSDIIFQGLDGSTSVSALTLDMSAAGAATFNSTITAGANSGVIKEIGSDLSLVQGAVGLRINDAASAISPTTASANNDNAVDLGVSNIRFKDIYLSGKLTNDGSGGISVDTSGNVGIGETSPSNLLHVKASDASIAPHPSAQIVLERDGTNYLQFLTTAAGTSGLLFGDTNDIDVSKIYVDHNTTKMTFVNETVETMTLNGAKVGIGTISPTSALMVTGGATVPGISIKSGGNSGVDPFRVTYVNGTEGDMFIVDDSGKVGIGTASPSEMLHIVGGGSGPELRFQNASGSHYIRAYNDNWNFLANSSNTAMTIKNSGQVNFGAGLGIGGTAAANTLDDYEEGTWTPVYDGATSASGVQYTSRSGSYTKVGNTVTASCNMVLSNKGTVAGVSRISGLPFAGNASPAFHVIAPMFGNLDLDANQQGTGAQYAVNSFVYLFVTENDTGLAQMTNGQVNNNTDFHFTVTYMTNS